MRDDWSDVRVAVVGNFNPADSGRNYQAEVLANQFEAEGARVLRVTHEQNRYRRPFATLRELVRGRGLFDVACIQTFSNWNFLNAAVALLVARTLGKRVVVVYRGGAGPQFVQRRRWLVLPLLRRADALVVPSGYLEAAFQQLGLTPIVIPNVIALAEFPFRLRRSFGPKLVWVRHFRDGYNPAMALDVLERLRRAHGGATLTMVGEGHLRQALEAEVRARGLQGVQFTGQLPQAQVAQRLDEADIFISTTNYDNQPRSLLEAMAAGIPVVSTRVGGVPYLIEDGVNGCLVSPADADAMAEAVSTIVAEPAWGATLVANARQRLQSFTWGSVGPRWFNVLVGRTGKN